MAGLAGAQRKPPWSKLLRHGRILIENLVRLYVMQFDCLGPNSCAGIDLVGIDQEENRYYNEQQELSKSEEVRYQLSRTHSGE
jgi:hypothetical protein